MNPPQKDKPNAALPDPTKLEEARRTLEQGFEQVQDEAAAREILNKGLPAVTSPESPGTPLEKAALEAAAPNAPEVDAALDAAITQAGREQALPARAERGRNLLRRELVKRLRPLEAVDTVLFLQVNQVPHPPAVDRWMFRYSYLMTGGWAWLLVPLAAWLLARTPEGRKRAALAAAAVVPPLWLATATVEYPVKHFFRRRRPFTDIVRAIVVGRRAASFSFPSGHSAAAFAGAVLLHKYFPRQSPAFYTAALMVAFSRVYLGAHYPGDVATGGLLGAALARTIHGGWSRILRRWLG
jgi:undecaprenyl-diphosphatase